MGGNHGSEKIRFSAQAREQMLRGIDILANAVRAGEAFAVNSYFNRPDGI